MYCDRARCDLSVINRSNSNSFVILNNHGEQGPSPHDCARPIRSTGPILSFFTLRDPQAGDTRCPSLYTAHLDRDRVAPTLVLARALILAQLAWLIVFGLLEYRQDSLTLDFGFYNQVTWLIGHGHLNPYSTIMGSRAWRNDGELILWPLAILRDLPPGAFWLKIVQAVALSGTSWVTVSWVADLVRSATWKSRLRPELAIALATVLLVANPLVFSAQAFDFHVEPLGALFAVGAGRDMWRGRRSMWIWIALTLACGTACVLLIAGLGVVALCMPGGPGRLKVPRVTGLYMFMIVLMWAVLLQLTHADRGAQVAGYGYLTGGGHPSALGLAKGMLEHPKLIAQQVWMNRWHIWDDLAPSGLLGLLTPWGWAMALVVLGPSVLSYGSFLSAQGFQNTPVSAFVVFGTILVLSRLWTMKSVRSGVLSALAGVLTLAAALWGISQARSYYGYWLQIRSPAAAALQHAEHIVPPKAEVLASQGIVGRFATRPRAYTLFSPPTFRGNGRNDQLLIQVHGFNIPLPLDRGPLYVVLTPEVGIETVTPDQAVTVLIQLYARGASILEARAGVWVLRWTAGHDHAH